MRSNLFYYSSIPSISITRFIFNKSCNSKPYSISFYFCNFRFFFIFSMISFNKSKFSRIFSSTSTDITSSFTFFSNCNFWNFPYSSIVIFFIYISFIFTWFIKYYITFSYWFDFIFIKSIRFSVFFRGIFFIWISNYFKLVSFISNFCFWSLCWGYISFPFFFFNINSFFFIIFYSCFITFCSICFFIYFIYIFICFCLF